MKQQFGKKIKMIGESKHSNLYVQSFTKNNKYKRIFKPNSFDLVISDEAHRSLGQEVEMFLSILLDLN